MRLNSGLILRTDCKPDGVLGCSAYKKPPLIDATELTRQFEDFTWAEDVTLSKVAICEMGAKKIENDAGDVIDERYTEITSKAMPGCSGTDP